MSLLTKIIFRTVWRKSLQKFDESNLIRIQCYTCLSSSYQAEFQKFGNQPISSLKVVRKLNFDFKTAQNILANTFDKIFAQQKSKQKYVGFLWYKSLDEVNIDEFFTLLEMQDTFFSWFKVIELHVWMLLFRMNQDGHTLRYLRDGVMEAMLLDMDSRAKMLDSDKRNYKKNFLKLYEKFKMTLFWYDYGYLEDDKVLASIVWSVFFERKCDDPEKLEAVVRFIRYQIKHLQSIDTKILEENEKTGVWTSLNPHCKRFLS